MHGKGIDGQAACEAACSLVELARLGLCDERRTQGVWGGSVRRRPVGSLHGYAGPRGRASGCALSYSQPRPISHLGAALAWSYIGLAFNTGVGELDDLPANVGVGVCRGTDGAVDLLGI